MSDDSRTHLPGDPAGPAASTPDTTHGAAGPAATDPPAALPPTRAAVAPRRLDRGATRDNVLFATIGALAGFISGYFMHEVMAVRQPPPLAVLQAAQAAAGGGAPHAGLGGPAGGGAPAGSAAAGGAMPQGAGPAMEDINRLKQQIEQNPEDADAILQLANLNYDIANWARARELYERYLQLRPPQPDVLTDLGVATRGVGDFRAALAYFEQAQQLQDGHWQSLYNQVVVLAFDLQELPRAREVLARLQALQPDNAEVSRLAQEVAQRGGAA